MTLDLGGGPAVPIYSLTPRGRVVLRLMGRYDDMRDEDSVILAIDTFDGFFVRTMFLSMSHEKRGNREMVFETVVFTDSDRISCFVELRLNWRRSATISGARQDHREVVRRVKRTLRRERRAQIRFAKQLRRGQM
jgi:hypothetical protein